MPINKSPNEPINLVYFGSPSFSADILRSLITDPPPQSGKYSWGIGSTLRVCAVVTTPDKPIGRSQTLTPSSVAQIAEKYHLPAFKPAVLDATNLAHLKLLKPDIFLVAAYGQIIPPDYLALPKLAPLNLHFSLLPKYRGALCLQEALKNGDPKTGVTLMQIDAQMDHGPVISQLSQDIDTGDNVATLQTKLTQQAIELLKRDLPLYLTGKLKPVPQDESHASYTPSLKTLTHQNAFIPWEQIKRATEGTEPSVSLNIHDLIRSLNPEPGAWTKINNQEIKIVSTNLSNDHLVIDIIQPTAKNPTSWQQFLSGHPLSS